MSKINTKEKNQNKVNETKTVENIKYEPILKSVLLLSDVKMSENSSPWPVDKIWSFNS